MKKIAIFLIFTFPLFLSQLKAQPVATLKGKISDMDHLPVENAHILIEESDIRTFSLSDGSYSITIPAERTVKIRFQHISHLDSTISVYLQPGEQKQINIVLATRGEKLRTLDVKAKYNDGYVRIDPKLNYKVPTPSGGVESILKMMPGINSSNELSSQYNVRGGNYDENLVYVNDIEIHRPFLVRSAQQEGLSFVNLDLTNSVKFSAGGFEPRYGDKMSSVMDVEYRKPTGYAGSVSASLLGATAHAEGNVKNIFTFLVGIRYKSNAYLLKSLETKGDYKPRFFDAQMLLSWRPVKKLEISLLGNFSRNKYLFIPTERETNFGSIKEIKRLNVYFEGQEVDLYENYLGGLTFTYKPDRNNQIKLILSSYYARESETYDLQGQYFLKDIQADMGSSDNEMGQEVSSRAVGTELKHARNYITAIVSAADLRGEHRLKNNVISWSTKFQNEIIRDRIKEWRMLDSSGYVLPQFPTIPGELVPFDDPSRILGLKENDYLATANELNTLRISGFIQDTWKIDGDSATRFTLVAGLRYNIWSYNKELLLSPRINFIYKPRWKDDWIFYIRTGIYYQPPFYREMRDKNGVLNPDIKAQRSYQVVAASEYNFRIWNRPFKLSAEAYYKYMDRLISYTVDNVKIIYSGKNDAVGYATGIDVKLSGEFIHGLESWIAVSLMKTAEDILDDYYYDKSGNRVEPGYIPRPTDQRFSINLFFQDHIPNVEPLRVHLNFIFSSGTPYGAPNAERFRSLYTDTNGKTKILRTSWYRRVDIGFSYVFLDPARDRMKHHSKFLRALKSLGVYLEVFNLLGTNNISSYTWISDMGSQLIPVPNYLTQRLFNIKLAVEF